MEHAVAILPFAREATASLERDHWSRVYAGLPVGLAVYGEGRPVYANEAFCVIARSCGLIPEAAGFEAAAAVFRPGPPAPEGSGSAAFGTRFPGVEKYVTWPDGRVAWYRVHLSRLTAPGGAARLVLVIDEVSRYRELIDLLVNRHKLYRGFVEKRADPLCRFLPDLSLLYANASFCKCFGRARGQVVGKNFMDMIRPEDRPAFVATLEAITPDSASAELEHRLAAPGGRPLWIKWTFTGFFYRTGHIKDYQAVGLDVSEHKIAEERVFQADRLVSLGTLVSGVAHEVNNPNNFIMFNAPLLASIWEKVMPVLRRAMGAKDEGGIDGIGLDTLDADVRSLLSGIAEGASRIKNIVGELKQYARVQDDGVDTLVSANEIVASAIVLLGKTIRSHTANFSVRYGQDLPVVRGSFQRLEQVVLNLVQNACQALADTAKGVEIATSNDPKAGTVRITVRDQGAGIAPECLARVFDPFFSTRSARGGTGLGLPISQKIVKEHGGALEIDSRPGLGTTVVVTLPAAN